jgi:hypothetical protein
MKINSFVLKTLERNWLEIIKSLCKSGGYEIIIKQQSAIIYKQGWLHPIEADRIAVDTVKVHPLWLGTNEKLKYLSLINQRIYIDSKGSQIPQDEHNLQITGKLNRAKSYQLLAQLNDVYQFLQSSMEFHPFSYQELSESSNLSLHTSGQGRKCSFELTQDLWKGISNSGFYTVPKDYQFFIVNDNERKGGAEILNEYISQTYKKLHSMGVIPPTVHKIGLDSLTKRLLAPLPNKVNSSVFVIAVDGKVGDPLPEKQIRLMKLLDEHGLSYRLFSYENKNLIYSVSNHLVSSIQAVGGKPYILNLPYPEDFSKGAFIGIDLGHSHRGSVDRFSNLAISLVDYQGQHVLTVVKRLALNESPSFDHIEQCLTELIKQSESLLGYRLDKIIMLRDGFMGLQNSKNSHETIEKYKRVIKIPFTLLEFRKRGNPPLFAKKNNSIHPIDAVAFGWGNDSVRLMNCYKPMTDNGLVRTFKVSLPRNAEGLGWGMDKYCQLIYGLCYSPSLGVKPHLPAPIYWADGIAKTSVRDHRFSGQRVIELNM